ncbi:hypothetical protein N7493_008095 [Penicillium malachiteum]|uniref:Uncharacterized protein n=1 Tax=Penicillium malachiteum TaxID=1324776 RepID=A0AAD6MTD8_9EURO|nr:hypothetical protein N7493_008095 [Penicillium malachiteum]
MDARSSHDEAGAREYRKASLQYFKLTLLGEGDAPDLSVFDVELRNGLQCWDEVGKHICQVCSFCKAHLIVPSNSLFNNDSNFNEATGEVLCDEMLKYVGSLNSLDGIFTEHGFPSVERYWEMREATAAAYCVIAIIPYEAKVKPNSEQNH